MLPGLDEKEIEVTLHDGVPTLKGREEAANRSTLYSERWQGQFQRSLQLDPEVDPDKIDAPFKNGLLTVTAAKRPEAQRHPGAFRSRLAELKPRPVTVSCNPLRSAVGGALLSAAETLYMAFTECQPREIGS
jgi:hypothetical protein